MKRETEDRKLENWKTGNWKLEKGERNGQDVKI